jgi:myo-inositol-1(or 4)-monophosphatase
LKEGQLSDADSSELRLLVAEAVAREAGVHARRRFLDSSFKVGLKGPHDFLTEVDGETEEMIAGRLLQIFPRDGFLGEETRGRAARDGGALWVVDPIDGTSNFVRGVAHFCTSIACVFGGKVEVGVIYDPMRDELFSARRGGGAHLNGAAISPSNATVLLNTSVEVGWSARHGAETYLDLVRRVALAGAAPARSGSGALGIVYVAVGRRDGYVEQHMKPWDCLAALVIVREAGGYVSDFLAGDGLAKGNPILASAPGVKEALISAVALEGIVL